MKKQLRIPAVLLSAILLFVMVSGCGAQNEPSVDSGGPVHVETKIKGELDREPFVWLLGADVVVQKDEDTDAYTIEEVGIPQPFESQKKGSAYDLEPVSEVKIEEKDPQTYQVHQTFNLNKDHNFVVEVTLSAQLTLDTKTGKVTAEPLPVETAWPE